jgi:hypothetical protein
MVLTAALWVACSSTAPQQAGGGGEITNGLCSVNGMAAPGVTVVAFPYDYAANRGGALPAFTTTDSLGAFAFQLDEGIYNLYAFDSASGRGMFVPGVDQGSYLGPIELLPVGTISGSVTRAATSPMPIDVYIAGSPFHTVLAQPGDFSFSNVPPGSYRVVASTVAPAPCDSGMLCGGQDVRDSVRAVVGSGSAVSVGTLDVSNP